MTSPAAVLWQRLTARASAWWQRQWRDDAGVPGYWLTRFLVLRLLGLVYLMAFLTLVFQGPALIGSHGLLPMADDLAAASARGSGFLQAPSLFWWGGDRLMVAAGWVGVALSLLVLGGYANALMLLVLWALQLSITNVGGLFYAFGWESQLCETGFLCVFLCPLLDGRPFPRRSPPRLVTALLLWLIVRIMWGAGLIKLRGAACWTELTCLDYHFETQPVPNPLSPYFHALPAWAHRLGVLFNHVVELLAPVLVFVPRRRPRLVAGALFLGLQLILILSGNLSFLNYLTIVPILACFDDGVLRRVLPGRLVAAAERARAAAQPSRPQRVAVGLLFGAVLLLSFPPVLNLLSSRQIMNGSFERLQLVNTYGAFGSVGQVRDELIIEGTTDEVLTPRTRWRAYELPCKPGDPQRPPCLMSPYHRRLDWLLWFAAMGGPGEYPFVVHLCWKLLEADRPTLGLLSYDPFAGARPRFVRVERYRYRFARSGAAVWERTRLGPWLPPLALDNEELRAYMREAGWLREP